MCQVLIMKLDMIDLENFTLDINKIINCLQKLKSVCSGVYLELRK